MYRIDDDDYVIFNSDDSDFGSAGTILFFKIQIHYYLSHRYPG